VYLSQREPQHHILSTVMVSLSVRGLTVAEQTLFVNIERTTYLKKHALNNVESSILIKQKVAVMPSDSSMPKMTAAKSSNAELISPVANLRLMQLDLNINALS